MLSRAVIAEAEPVNAVSVPWILAVLLHRRRLIAACGVAGLLLALVATLFQRHEYVASFSFLPQSAPDQTRGGLASLAGQFGIPIGSLGSQSQPPQFYADLLSTREVLTPIAEDTFATTDGHRVALSDLLRAKGSNPAIRLERTLEALRAKVVSTSVATRTTGMVSVAVRTRDPQVSLVIANRLIDGLNRFNRTTRQSQATEEREFTEGRLNEARAKVRAAEDALQSFLQRNRQFESPQLAFERDRLQRELLFQQQIMTGLAQQYEEARIREVRDTPVITIVERPVLPAVPEPLHRARLLVLFVGMMVTLGALFALARAGWDRRRAEVPNDESYDLLASEWKVFRGRASASHAER